MKGTCDSRFLRAKIQFQGCKLTGLFVIKSWRCLVQVIAAMFCAAAASASVKVNEQTILIPTYLSGPPDPNPMFYFGQGSQGAEGRVYPYPLYDNLSNVKSNKAYRIVYLENEYVRVGILPEIGGRLFEAVDKSDGYNFIYRQHVIKPALIGLIGAWISGGIEWNIPHHHRATTFLPVQYRVEESPDGSKTVWVGELEVRQRMRWAVGYTLRPGKSYLECSVRILNRTPFVNTMLCFANVAVHVDNDYQVIYPPHTQFVTFHGKREFTTWPIATTRYAGEDFSGGVDVSWYSNHVAATSMFAWNYDDDFFAGYDHGKHAGIISVADHHIVPGKKFWTWGTGPRGRMWDKILTDTDGPYIELMVGAYSDNQPDYSWLQPYETKSFQMFWYPFQKIDGVKAANLQGAVNLEISTNGAARIGFCTTEAHPKATASIKAGDKVLWQQDISIKPGQGFLKELALPKGLNEHSLHAALSVNGAELVGYSPPQLAKPKMPEPVQGPPPPAEVSTVEELYLAGQRMEQFHSPNSHPERYWEEALRRDPANARVNTALGIRELKQARFAEAEKHFRNVIERLTKNYTAPKDGEPFYYLGLALNAQAKETEAFDAFFKATWSEAWRSPAYFSLAEIATRRGQFGAALDYLNRALWANGLNLRALTLKAAVLRQEGRTKEALASLELAASQTDPLDVRVMAERWLAGNNKAGTELATALREHPATGLETAMEYAGAGLWREGIALLEHAARAMKDKSTLSPLAYYYLGDFCEHLGDSTKAGEYRQLAGKMSPEYVFPFQWEAIAVLRRAMEANSKDSRAPYYLGNLLFDGQPEEAVRLWQLSAQLEPSFPIVHRNLALAYWHRTKTNDLGAAIAELEQAVAAPVKYAKHFTELDQLYGSAGAPPEKRLELLERNHPIVSQRDDSLSCEIGMKIFAGKYDEAIGLMTGRKFSVWEGGSLEVVQHWVNAHLLRGRREIAGGKFSAALADFEAAKAIPDNLPAEQEVGREQEIGYWVGVAEEGKGNRAEARKVWQQVANGTEKIANRRRDKSSERQAQIFYQALAGRKLGEEQQAQEKFRDLIQAAGRTLQGEPDQASIAGRHRDARAALAHYLTGLSHLGLDEKEKAEAEFKLTLQAAPDLLGAKAELDDLRTGQR